MKQNRITAVVQLALAGALLGVNNAIANAHEEELIASTAAEGVFLDAAGAALASVSAYPFHVVTSADCPTGYRRVVRPGYSGVVEAKLHSTAGSIVKGSRLQLHSDGTLKLDLGTGARNIVAIAQEAKVSESQLLKVRLLSDPVVYAS